MFIVLVFTLFALVSFGLLGFNFFLLIYCFKAVCFEVNDSVLLIFIHLSLDLTQFLFHPHCCTHCPL
jgi:hypothetical protein